MLAIRVCHVGQERHSAVLVMRTGRVGDKNEPFLSYGRHFGDENESSRCQQRVMLVPTTIHVQDKTSRAGDENELS